MMRNVPRPWLLVIALATAFVFPAAGQESTSSALAVQLAEIMTSGQLDAVAARDSEENDRFVAALAFPGQLLVVSARYEVPLYVEEKITKGEYREVYIDLNAASISDSKVLITDSGANGLAVQGERIDIYDVGSRLVRFDGDWAGQQMSEEEYMKIFSDADEKYARMLKVLIAEAR